MVNSEAYNTASMIKSNCAVFGFCLVNSDVQTLTQNQMERGKKRRTRVKAKTISSHSNTPKFLRFRPVEMVRGTLFNNTQITQNEDWNLTI